MLSCLSPYAAAPQLAVAVLRMLTCLQCCLLLVTACSACAVLLPCRSHAWLSVLVTCCATCAMLLHCRSHALILTACTYYSLCCLCHIAALQKPCTCMHRDLKSFLHSQLLVCEALHAVTAMRCIGVRRARTHCAKNCPATADMFLSDMHKHSVGYTRCQA